MIKSKFSSNHKIFNQIYIQAALVQLKSTFRWVFGLIQLKSIQLNSIQIKIEKINKVSISYFYSLVMFLWLYIQQHTFQANWTEVVDGTWTKRNPIGKLTCAKPSSSASIQTQCNTTQRNALSIFNFKALNLSLTLAWLGLL